MKRLIVVGFLALAVFIAAPAFALEVENADKMPYSLDANTVTVYSAAFFRHLPDWMPEANPPKFFPEQVYGVIAHEFFCKTLSYQYHINMFLTAISIAPWSSAIRLRKFCGLLTRVR